MHTKPVTALLSKEDPKHQSDTNPHCAYRPLIICASSQPKGAHTGMNSLRLDSLEQGPRPTYWNGANDAGTEIKWDSTKDPIRHVYGNPKIYKMSAFQTKLIA